MEWKSGKLVNLIIKSTLGGNLRIRVPNEMNANNGAGLKKATGENPNPFFYHVAVTDPIVSSEANIETPILNTTWLYDLPTEKGKTYQFIMHQ